VKLSNIVATLTLCSVLAVAAPHNKKDPELQEVMQTAQQTTQLLLKTLGSNMKKQMKSGGAMKALDFCATKAYDLTEDVNKKLPQGVSVKRISLNYRNPANAPEKEEIKILEALETLQKNRVILPKRIVEKTSQHTYKVYKPLVIKKQVCLQCHGDIQNQKLKNAIDTKYPNDKAQHYKMGDLRGAVVVTVKK
jgi:hypothetical protein